MDAIEFLTEHHRHVEDLFDRLDVIDKEDEKTEVFTHLARALAIQDTIEREHLYPLLRERSFQPEAQRCLDFHDTVDQRVSELLDVPTDEEDFDRKLAKLWDVVDAHYRQEENSVFPRLREVVDADTLEELEKEMRATAEALPDRDPRALLTPEAVPPGP